MPLQNRVNPEGDICVSKARGALMGNRGCLHNEARKIVSRSKRDAWVTCITELKAGWEKRTPMTPGAYTELFFLDEATALAAGHRPCASCRRDRYDAFFAAWATGNRNGTKVLAGEVDKQMKQDRGPAALREVSALAGLPDGVIVKQIATGAFYLIRANKLYPWSFDGYGPAQALTAAKGPYTILTPASTVKALQNGYTAEIHHSAI